jgi:hypothetical protein
VTPNVSRCRTLTVALAIMLATFALLPVAATAQDGPPPAADAAVEPHPITGAMRVVQWSVLNPADNVYDWTVIDQRITDTKAKGLKLGLMTSTYDGSSSGDIRSTPNFVIKGNDTVIPVNKSDGAAEYLNYWSRANLNGAFDNSNHEYLWTKSGNVSVVDGPDSGTNYAAKLGGVTNASGYIYHYDQPIPAMPSTLNGTKRAYIEARVYIDTTDTGANDHLYFELWDLNNAKIGGASLDVTNLAHTNKTWKTYQWDVSSFGLEKTVRVAFRVTGNASNATTFYVDDVKPFVRHLIPKYQNASYSDPYVKFVHALGARYKDNPDLQFVSFGTGVYGENQPTQDSYDYVVDGAGLTQQGWVNYINKVTQAHVDAFTSVPGQPPARSILLQYAPTYKSPQEREDTTDYAGVRKVGLSANFLSPDFSNAYKNDGTGQYDPLQKFLGQVPIAFESYDSDLCNPVLSFAGMAHALDKKVDYQRVDQPSLSTQADKDNIAWAKPYFGKNAQTTPKVWVMMREHRNPTMLSCRSGGVIYTSSSGSYFWPDLGNFDFYLKQVDSISGGKTVAETNDKGVDSRYAKDASGNARPDAGLGACPSNKPYREDLFGANYPCFKEPYNPDLPPLVGQNPGDYTDFYTPTDWTGEGKEAYTVRRTDQATNNPYMFFLIDNGYIPGDQTYSAKITVAYFDIGTDKWSLKYDSTSGEKSAGTVTKTGSKTLKTVTFTVTDGRFGGRLTGGADFYIDSRNGTTNDGNEWIHMVEVERTSTLTTPKAPAVMIAASGADANLTWPAVTQDTSGKSAVVDHYDVWRSAAPYFSPNTTADTPYARVFAPGFTEVGARNNGGGAFYVVTAVSATPSALSNRVGVFGYSLVKGQ